MKRKLNATHQREPKRRKTGTQRTTTASVVRGPRTKSTSVDIKYTVTQVVATGVLNTGTATDLLANMVRGDNSKNNFVGMKITPKGFTIRLEMVLINAVDHVRLVIGQSIRGATPTIGNLFDNTGNANAPYTSYNRSYKTNVNILVDRLYTLSTNEGASLTDVIYVSGKKMVPVEFDPTAATKINGGLTIWLLSQAAAGGPTIAYNAETTYTDA